jgi:hypothetical protein
LFLIDAAGTPAIVGEPQGETPGAKYILAEDNTGSAWPSEPTYELGTGDNLKPLAATLISDSPGFATEIQGNGDLAYVGTASPSGVPALLPNDTLLPSPSTASLCQLGSTIGIAVQRAGSDPDLIFMRSRNLNGSLWELPLVVDFVGSTGIRPVMLSIEEVPVVFYFDSTFLALKHIRPMDAEMLEWGPPAFLQFQASSLFTAAEVQERVFLVFQPRTTGSTFEDELRLIASNDQAATHWGRVTPVASGLQIPASSVRLGQGNLVLAGGSDVPALCLVTEIDGDPDFPQLRVGAFY